MIKKSTKKLFFTLFLILVLSLNLFSFYNNDKYQDMQNFKKILEDKSSLDFKIFSSNIDFNKFLLENLIDYKNNESIFYSPFGIQVLFSYLLNGISGQSLKELKRFLFYESFNIDAINNYYKIVLQNIFNDKAKSLKFGNSFWLNKGSDLYKDVNLKGLKLISEDFLTIAKKYYYMDIFEEDLLKESGFKLIEKWVSKKTENKIKSFFDRSIINADTIAILLNALYFHENWATPFDIKNTKTDEFTTLDDKKVKIDFMNFSSPKKLLYYEDDSIQVVRLPYDKFKNSLIIFLPKELRKTKETLNLMFSKDYIGILEKMQPLEGYVKFPKISCEYKYELNDILQKSGLISIFNPSLDFYPLFNKEIKGINEELFKIDKIFQKTYLKIDEKGTTAASATAVSIIKVTTSIEKKIFYFIADHPFFYFLIDERSGNIIFTGFYNG